MDQGPAVQHLRLLHLALEQVQPLAVPGQQERAAQGVQHRRRRPGAAVLGLLLQGDAQLHGRQGRQGEEGDDPQRAVLPMNRDCGHGQLPLSLPYL